MNILRLLETFRTQEQAVEYLELVRWNGHASCPYCTGTKVCRHVSGDRAGQRWQCQECSKAFSATVGTIFHGTHVPLKNWYLVLAIMLGGGAPPSAYRIARDIGMRRPTVSAMMHKARAAISDDSTQCQLLRRLVEVDEATFGLKKRGSGGVRRQPYKRARNMLKSSSVRAGV